MCAGREAEGPHQDFIRLLAARWHEFNERHFEGRLSPAYLAVSEPRSPRAIANRVMEALGL
jgi:hypothetical protein